jgi:hypothetical protein
MAAEHGIAKREPVLSRLLDAPRERMAVVSAERLEEVKKYGAVEGGTDA